MADVGNIDAPMGMRPIQHLDGSPWNGKVKEYIIPASDGTAVGLGDPVMILEGGSADGIPYCIKRTAGSAFLGVIVGFKPESVETLDQIYRLASTKRTAMVCTAPDVIYEVQEDSLVSTLAAADISKFADITVTAVSATTGQSTVELDSSSKVSTTADVRILNLVQRPDNAIGDNAKWHVLINVSAFKADVLATV